MLLGSGDGTVCLTIVRLLHAWAEAPGVGPRWPGNSTRTISAAGTARSTNNLRNGCGLVKKVVMACPPEKIRCDCTRGGKTVAQPSPAAPLPCAGEEEFLRRSRRGTCGAQGPYTVRARNVLPVPASDAHPRAGAEGIGEVAHRAHIDGHGIEMSGRRHAAGRIAEYGTRGKCGQKSQDRKQAAQALPVNTKEVARRANDKRKPWGINGPAPALMWSKRKRPRRYGGASALSSDL